MEQCHDTQDTQDTFIDVVENVLGVVDNVVEIVENVLGSWNTSWGSWGRTFWGARAGGSRRIFGAVQLTNWAHGIVRPIVL